MSLVVIMTSLLLFVCVESRFKMPVIKTCAPTETCSYSPFGFELRLCKCPGPNTNCPKQNTVEHQGTVYRFCAPYSPEVCLPGQVSTVISGIQTSILCRCPADWAMERDGEDSDQFVCKPIFKCEPDQVCEERRNNHIRRHCNCEFGSSCEHSASFQSDVTQFGKCVVL